MPSHTHTHMHARIHARMHTHTHTHMHAHTHMHTHTHNVHTYKHITHTHTQTHTRHTHTLTKMFPLLSEPWSLHQSFSVETAHEWRCHRQHPFSAQCVVSQFTRAGHHLKRKAQKFMTHEERYREEESGGRNPLKERRQKRGKNWRE